MNVNTLKTIRYVTGNQCTHISSSAEREIRGHWLTVLAGQLCKHLNVLPLNSAQHMSPGCGSKVASTGSLLHRSSICVINSLSVFIAETIRRNCHHKCQCMSPQMSMYMSPQISMFVSILLAEPTVTWTRPFEDRKQKKQSINQLCNQ